MTEEQQDMIKDCQARESRLSEWEFNFIEDISHRDSLTERQDEKLTQIWERIT